MSEAYIGELRVFAFGIIPRNWAPCNGQLLAINQNQALFSILGTTYGGNGQTTFALPNLQGRVPLHWGQGQGLPSYALGQLGGSAGVTLTTDQIPSHSHVPMASQSPATDSPQGAFWASSANGDNQYDNGRNNLMNAGAVGNTGGSLPHNNMQPSLVLNICICLYGIFPPHN